jgi:hypothetical protein
VRLPNADQAVVADAKVREYLLSPGPLGRQASVITVWIVPEGREFAHFVTAFPG